MSEADRGGPGAARSLRRVATPAALLALLALGSEGCVRRQRYEPLRADSTATVPVDSLAIIVRDAQAKWDVPGGGEEAARLSARLVLNDLVVQSRVEPTLSWEERSRALLDSLAFGAELSSTRCALLVNFFSRSDPDQGAWPWLFWCGPKGIASEPLDARALKLLGISARGLWGDPPHPPGAPGAAVLFGRRGAGGQHPLLMVWNLATGRAELGQVLGPDSLGGAGTGTFSIEEDTTIVLATRTYRGTPRFDECATCPHVWQLRRFRWGPLGFERLSEEVVPSPYATFVSFVQAIALDDRDLARALVTEPGWVETARRLNWSEFRGAWRAAPGSDEAAREIVFFRGQQEAYRVTFEPREGRWLISGFRATTASIE